MKQQSLIFLVVLGVVVAVSSVFISNSACAKVTGHCANCHTMHNSQNGATVAVGGAGAALTVSDCVGCHSSTTSATIIDLGESRIPIVYNTVEPAKPLAGGNFYWVVNSGNEYGHNVLGIAGKDGALLSGAPGGVIGGCEDSCHVSLAIEQTDDPDFGSGCEGCHLRPGHHADDTGPVIDSAAEGWYRFLSGHYSGKNYGVAGVEDDDWQFETTVKHNEYLGQPGDHTDIGRFAKIGANTMTAYCCGCHGNFHIQENGTWVRHPSDAVLPAGGEYQYYTAYNPLVPVARPGLTGFDGTSTSVTPGTDMVMCLSCHRPHGSPHPDILRWDYTAMNAGTTGVAAGTGCFVCHTNKDGS